MYLSNFARYFLRSAIITFISLECFSIYFQQKTGFGGCWSVLENRVILTESQHPPKPALWIIAFRRDLPAFLSDIEQRMSSGKKCIMTCDLVFEESYPLSITRIAILCVLFHIQFDSI